VLHESCKESFRTSFALCKRNLVSFGRWLFLSCIIGTVVGFIASMFGYALIAVNSFRASVPLIVLGLPLGGLLIVASYHLAKDTDDRGTNTVILSLRGSTDIPFRMAPLIFVSTVVTHLFGGSAGREGAAVQLGGSIANRIGKWIHLSDDDRRVLVMCGMSAGFSALFGTPLAAAIFSLEVISVGVLHYSALVPCVTASLTAHFIAIFLKIPPEVFPVAAVPTMNPVMFLRIALLGILLAAVSILFCGILHGTEHLLERYMRNRYLRIVIAAIGLILVSAILGTGDYLGSGIHLIEEILHHGAKVVPYAFLIKILFTSLTLGGGFKGGEIVPSLTIGALFGCTAAQFLGLPVDVASACGMIGVFCGVTNCPITTLCIAFELFGFAGMPYYLVTVAVSYMLSGSFSLYHTQQIVDSKARPHLIDIDGATIVHDNISEN